ncbi:MAG TPA: hypothetical protein PLO24_05850 [Bacteroidales bacterium]|mgnify:CR=1 FL=1|nr:hypothetical protein [Bacteroidales bacterium]HOS72555.1 hypothetical protein [Bacteroidales bacterium]HQH25338.1 hypothetical protein [Bacteroidales bacterium]HQJ82862.1 hypothetical protein [Bacteroidales bacterium]
MEIDLKYTCKAGPLIILTLLFFHSGLHSQKPPENDTIFQSIPGNHIKTPDPRLFSDAGWPVTVPQKLIPPTFRDNDRSFFTDTLRAKASKYLITKKLFDFVVVSGKPASAASAEGSSQNDYLRYSGRIIRKIDIKRLDVFGTSIDYSLISNSGRLENFLNKTHTNTAEHIIRKNLLFSEGDTLSPLLLSDNERILRQLPYIDDSRIIVVSETDGFVDILVLTKDVYSLGASAEFRSATRGSASLYEKNIFGLGHEFRLKVPFDQDSAGSPGIGMNYNINNISKSFINLSLRYYNALGRTSYGFAADRQLVSSSTKYAGGICVCQTSTTTDLDTLPEPEPLKFNHQDYWLSRSFLLKPENAARLILGVRYLNNNVYRHPDILPDSYHSLQKYRIYLASLSFSIRQFYKTSLIYGHGRTEDLPDGMLINLTAGRELNEFKQRFYSGLSLSAGKKLSGGGYFHGNAGLASFRNKNETEQGILILRANYFTKLRYAGTHRLRNFYNIDYTRGFGRYKDEYLLFSTENGLTGFRNDSIRAERQRLTMSIESVLFSPARIYGFRLAWFGFGDLGYLFGTNQFFNQGKVISRIGFGVRLRNDNLVFNTLQIRFSFFPNLPPYSRISNFNVSGEQLLNPDNFEPGRPDLLPYR